MHQFLVQIQMEWVERNAMESINALVAAAVLHHHKVVLTTDTSELLYQIPKYL
jgi:hypothetical protein